MRLQIVEHAKGALTSYWFIPLLCAAGAIALALIAGWLDELSASGRVPALPFFRRASASGTRAILSTIAGSSISVAGIVFSISMVVLSMASSQFGPRLLPNFFRRNSTQVVFGAFLATFLTALIVLVQMTDAGSGAELHSYAVALSFALAVASFGLLVYFLHSVTTFIQVPRIIDEVACDLAATLTRETTAGPEPGDPQENAASADDAFARLNSDAREVEATRGGYIQALDVAGVLELAAERDLYVRFLHRPGQYVAAGEPLARAAPAARVEDEIAGALRRLFVIGVQRNNSQDVEFALDQLVEIALRALSPGVNDPFTAINCIDRLGDALSILAERRFPPEVRRDRKGHARVLAVADTDEGILDAAFNPLRQHGCSNAAVAIRLLECITSLARRSSRASMKRALRDHAGRIREACGRGIAAASDLRDIEERYREALSAL